MKNMNIQDLNNDSGTDFWESFKEKLLSVEKFPSIFTFKFIVPNSVENRKTIETIFEHSSTKIQLKQSSSAKYLSMTVETFVSTVDEVIAYYKQVAVIEKVIML